MVAKCPACGKRLWHVILDEPGVTENLCPKCGKSISVDSVPQSEYSRQKNQPYLAQHFGSMASNAPETDVDTWPEEFGDYFPGPGQPYPEGEKPDWLLEIEGEADAEISEDLELKEENRFSDLEREEAHRRWLRSQGLTMDVDSQGLRLTSISTGRGSSHSNLSSYDIVRLASELEGGVIPVEERIQCPACEAVILPTDKICQWCSAPLA
jgi:hypothetical protein